MNPFNSGIFDAILFSCLLTFAGEPAKPDTAKPNAANIVQADATRIQGTWKVIQLEAAGEKAPAEIVAALKLVFNDSTLAFDPGEPGFTKYTFKLDPAAMPAAIDLIPAEGKGDTQKGIYALEGDTLKICLGGGVRPKAFPGKAPSETALYTMKRLKP